MAKTIAYLKQKTVFELPTVYQAIQMKNNQKRIEEVVVIL